MRIALVTGSFLPSVGGVEWKVHYLATEYTSRGHDVHVFTVRPPGHLSSVPMPVTPTYSLSRHGIHLRGMGRFGILDHLICRAIIREHRREPFDVLHCHHLGIPAKWGATVKARTGVPVVVTTCGDDVFAIPELNYGVMLEPRFDRMVRENCRSVDVIGSISRAVREALVGLGTTARLVDIPNGVSWDDFQTGPSQLLRERLRLAAEDVLILSVGRNINFKRYDLGIRAFAAVAGRFPAAHYVLVGRELNPLESFIRELGVEGRVHFIEQMPMAMLPAVFHSADIFFNPSMREGFAQVNAQALASGLPCVITDGPGNVDAADHGGALIARSEDADSMAAELARLLAEPPLRRRLAEEAHRGSRHYAWSRIAEQYLEVFGDLAGRPVRTPVSAGAR